MTQPQGDRYRSWIPQGFDLLTPAATGRLLARKASIRDCFSRAGFHEITTPLFDFAQTFRLTHRESVRGPLFVTRDLDGDVLAVRSDLTVQVIKAVANGRLGTNFPQRVSYIQPVFKDHRKGSGHAREIMQAGVELVGDARPERIDEMLELARESLGEQSADLRMLYGDVRFLNRLFDGINGNGRVLLSEAFHNKDTARIKQIAVDLKLDPSRAEIFCEVPLIFGGTKALDRLLQLCRAEEQLVSVLEEARGKKDLIFDFSLVREQSYYSGPVFEAYLPGQGERVVSGGIYDDLFQEFGTENQPACGFAVNLSILP